MIEVIFCLCFSYFITANVTVNIITDIGRKYARQPDSQRLRERDSRHLKSGNEMIVPRQNICQRA